MTFHEFMFAAIAVFAIVLAYFANRQCSEVRHCLYPKRDKLGITT